MVCFYIMKNVRYDFPFFIHNPSLVYLDNAATTQKPQIVIDRIHHFYSVENAPVHRGFYDLAEQVTEQYEVVRKKIAKFLGAESQEIIFTHNATAGINLIAQSWARHNLKKGDEIVLTELEHHANIVPWLQLASEMDIGIRYIPMLSNGDLNYQAVDTLITPKTKLIAATAISNVLGTEVRIDLLANYAKKVGALLLVDACQAAARRRILVHEQKIDFLVFSGHKLLGPTGIGVLFVNKKLHSKMRPFISGGGSVYSVDYDRVAWREVPECFEAGTPAIASVLGLGSAINYMEQNIDITVLKQQEALLCTHLIDGLSAFKNVKILGPVDELRKTGHIVSFIVQGIHAYDVAAYLNKNNIAVRAGHHCAQPLHAKLGIDASLRVSFHGAYNTLDDVQEILRAFNNIIT
jgi:cysteine desulfurase / selenocysteine lyase